jgi:hypothetical protein
LNATNNRPLGIAVIINGNGLYAVHVMNIGKFLETGAGSCISLNVQKHRGIQGTLATSLMSMVSLRSLEMGTNKVIRLGLFVLHSTQVKGNSFLRIGKYFRLNQAFAHFLSLIFISGLTN